MMPDYSDLHSSKTLDDLLEQFIRDKKYLQNASNLTLKYYQRCFARFRKVLPTVNILDRSVLNDLLVGLRQTGISDETCNITIRGLNSFLTWLWENGHTGEHFKIKQIKTAKKVPRVFDDSHLKKLLSWKPKGFYEWRLYALLCLLIDTGVRIEEALTLTCDRVDFDNMLIIVTGKGNKQRIVPMSLELRRVLVKYQRMNPHEIFFCTRSGGRLSYHNILREFKAVVKELGIEGVKVSFHTLRHGFALNYLRNGGDVFHLQKALGHSDLKTTRGYVHLTTDDLQRAHKKTSILNRLR